MLTDTHCHLNVEHFNEDRDAVVQRALEAGVTRILIPGLDFASSRFAVELAESHPMLYAAIGIHPTEADSLTEEIYEQLMELAGHPKVVAIGEVGLDYYWVKDPVKQAAQRETLRAMMQLADNTLKPVVLHMREENDADYGNASRDILKIVDEWTGAWVHANHPLGLRPGVFHSFNGNLAAAEKAMQLGFYIGITGPVTYKNNHKTRELVGGLPLSRILIETDSPYQTPVPYRGRRNEPVFVGHIADKIADIHKTTREQIAEITSANANHLFGWEADS
jgi:TatD DNase family protein